MLKITDKSQCCGCEACIQVCPQNCITMETDSEGFNYPSVNSEKCIGCELCEKVCPIVNAKKCSENAIKTYAAYVKDDNTRLRSSSGGLFSIFAMEIINSGGIVYGAAFDEQWCVHHIKAETAEELDALRGSKYLQSRIEDTYKQVNYYLKSGRKVLFTGTACQIAGLKGYLRHDYENLFTVDVLCHGVPSPKVWKKYLSEKEDVHKAKITNALFRLKNTGWKNYNTKLEFNNGDCEEQIHINDIYMRLFLSNICLRPSCYACKFKALERPSDITIGDSWGIEKYMPDMDDDRGTSVVIIHSDKGMFLFSRCKENLVYKIAETDKILSPAADSRKSVIMHPKRDKFFKYLNNGYSIARLSSLTNSTLKSKILSKIKLIKSKY